MDYIAKGVLGFVIAGFCFQCSDPLSFLLDDTTLSVNKDKLLIYEGKTSTIGFRLNAKPFDEGKSVTLTAHLKCDGMSESEQKFSRNNGVKHHDMDTKQLGNVARFCLCCA